LLLNRLCICSLDTGQVKSRKFADWVTSSVTVTCYVHMHVPYAKRTVLLQEWVQCRGQSTRRSIHCGLAVPAHRRRLVSTGLQT